MNGCEETCSLSSWSGQNCNSFNGWKLLVFDGLVDAERQSIDVEPGLVVVERRDVERAVVDRWVDDERWSIEVEPGLVVVEQWDIE